MENTYNLISKYLKKRKWLFDGTQYVFRTAEWDESLMVCLIDCILPEKGQSYTRTKFRYNFDDIMTDVYDVFGEKIAFDVDFFVDGEVAKEVYLLS